MRCNGILECMNYQFSQKTLDRYFRLGAILKAVDACLELLGAILLVFVPIARLKGVVSALCLYEIQEDNHHAFIATFILHINQKINPHVQLFAVVYLLAHGTIKLLLAFALIKRYYRLYPYAIGFLIAFAGYQIYLIAFNHSLLLGILTVFDCAIAWLTYLELKRHRKLAPAA
jgi:uncharacterized membrane protein